MWHRNNERRARRAKTMEVEPARTRDMANKLCASIKVANSAFPFAKRPSGWRLLLLRR